MAGASRRLVPRRPCSQCGDERASQRTRIWASVLGNGEPIPVHRSGSGRATATGALNVFAAPRIHEGAHGLLRSPPVRGWSRHWRSLPRTMGAGPANRNSCFQGDTGQVGTEGDCALEGDQDRRAGGTAVNPGEGTPKSGGRVGRLQCLQPVQSPVKRRSRFRVTRTHGYRCRRHGCGKTFHQALGNCPDRAALTGQKCQRPGIAAKPAKYVKNKARPQPSFRCQPFTVWPRALRDMSSAVSAGLF